MINFDYRSPGFTGVHRLHPRSIVLMILFGFEVKISFSDATTVFSICYDESNSFPGGHPRDCLARTARPGLKQRPCNFNMVTKVDRIFLVEATVTHKGMRKPLIWERLKFTERFSFVNATKVDHVIVDDL